MKMKAKFYSKDLLVHCCININERITVMVFATISWKSLTVTGTYHTLSIHNLAKLAEVERKLYKVIPTKVRDVWTTNGLVGLYLMVHDLEQQQRGNPLPWEVVSNPIGCYTLIRRWVEYLLPVMAKIPEITKEFPPGLILPSQSDLFNAAKALLTTQYVYDLISAELSNGIIQGKVTNVGMSKPSVMDLCALAIETGMYTEARDWIKTSAFYASDQVMEQYEILAAEHDKNFWKKKSEEHLHMFTNPLGRYVLMGVPQRRNDYNLWGKKNPAKHEKARHYRALDLCNGHSLRMHRRNLRCHFDASRSAYGPLNPLRVEVLNKDPEVLWFHNFVPHSWTEKIRNISLPQFGRDLIPTVWEEKMPSHAAYTWHTDEELRKDHLCISKRVETATGLNVRNDASESLQVGLQSLAFDFHTHLDVNQTERVRFLKRSDDEDRGHTFMIFLSDIEKGGYTAFPILDVFIPPEEGSAVFWKNYNHHGEADYRLSHASCPVAMGHKWYATKYIKRSVNLGEEVCPK